MGRLWRLKWEMDAYLQDARLSLAPGDRFGLVFSRRKVRTFQWFGE